MVREGLRSMVRTGALFGLSVWLFYGTAEWFAKCFLPWLRNPSHVYVPLHPGFTAVVFVFYAVAGLLGGALCALAIYGLGAKFAWIRVRQQAVIVAAVQFSFMLAVGVGTIPYLPGGVSFRIGAVYLALAVLVAFAQITFRRVDSRWSSLCLPSWVASVLLILIPVTADRWPGVASVPIVAGTTLVISISLLCLFFPAVRRFATSINSHSPRIAVSLAAVSVCAGVFLQQSPFISSTVAPHTPTGRPPNVILITLDTVGAKHLSLYGYERDTSPHLSEFARHATVFSRAMSAGNMTLTSHGSLFTGLYPSWHHAYHAQDHPRGGGRPLPAAQTTLAEVLASRGYATLGVAANYAFLNPAFGLSQGFQYLDYRSPVKFLASTSKYFFRTRLERFANRWQLPQRSFRSAEEINASVDALLRARGMEGPPFFLFINYMDAHWPYLPPPPFDTKFPGKVPRFNTARYLETQIAVLQMKRSITDRERGHLVSQYDGAIAYLDFHLSKLILRLKQLQLYDSSLIVITADHGETFGDKNLIGHGLSLYQDEVHVPLIVKYPHSRQGTVISELVSLVDVMPTILEVLKYTPAAAQMHGTVLLASAPSGRNIISETFVNPFISEWHPKFKRTARALSSNGLKFISYSDGSRELYDLTTDADETHNLFSGHHPLETALAQWSKSVPATVRQAPAAVRQQTLETLRSLGYAQ